MHISTRRTVKIAILSILGVFTAFLVGVAVLINFIFTPEKLTPIIVRVLDDNLDAKVSFDRVELTFFSTFPNFSVRLENGSIVPNARIASQHDTLAQFRSCSATFDVNKLLRKNILDIKHLTLLEPKVNAVLDSSGKANWEIVKLSEPDTVQEEEGSFEIKSIVLRKFTLENADVSYTDIGSNTFACVADYNLELEALHNDLELDMNFASDAKNIHISHRGFILSDKISSAIKGQVHFDKISKLVRFKDSAVRLNDMDFVLNGALQLDSAGKQVHTDITMGLKVPSLHTLWESLPKRILKNEDMDVQGTVALTMTAKGVYAPGKYPVADISLKIHNGAIKYTNYPGEIKHLETDIRTVLDFNTIENSAIDIKKLAMKGTGINLEGKATVKNMLLNPAATTDLKASLDLTTIKKAYPLSKELKVSGQASLDLKAGFQVNEINAYNFKNLRLLGRATLHNLLIVSPEDSLYFNAQKAELAVGGDGITTGKNDFGHVNISKLKATYKKEHNLTVDGLSLDVMATALAGNRAKFHAAAKVNSLQYAAVGLMKSVFRKAHITAGLSPGKTENTPRVTMDLVVDSAAVWQGKQFLGMQNGNYKLTLNKDKQNRWVPKGHVEFNNLIAYVPEFPLPMRMKHSRVQVDNREITLDNAHINLGNSDVTLTGKLVNFISLRGAEGDTIKAYLTLKANYIDANEMMKVLHDQPDNTIEVEKVTVGEASQRSTASTEKAVFTIPYNIDFAFVSSVKALRFGDLDITNAKGLVRIKDGTVKLQGFHLETLAAKLSTDLTYTPESERSARLRFKFHIADVQLANLRKLMPALDTLLPMARSFEGKVNFRMQGTMKLDEKMEVVIPSMISIAAIQARDIMLLDSEAFRELAKTLKFKSKEKNNIKTLDMEMLIEKSHLEILPALVEIDRYKVAVGGIQNLNLSYDYHISVLESPIPFKTGINIKGSNLDDYKISLSKAKYKYYFTDKKRLKEKADSTIIYKKQAILDRLNLTS